MITGALRLTSLAHYLPTTVIGGYLAYIGQYCFEAGLALMTSETMDCVPLVQVFAFSAPPPLSLAQYHSHSLPQNRLPTAMTRTGLQSV